MDRCAQAVVADDNAVFLRALVAILEDQGVEVVGVADDGVSALAAVEITRPDVLVIDIKMPRMDGVSVTSAVRRDFPETQVVCLTAYDDERLLHAASAAGATACLVKGARATEVTAAVKAAATA